MANKLPSEVSDKLAMVNEYRKDPVLAAKDLLHLDLPPHQRLALRVMWICDQNMTVWTRGGGKTFVDAVFGTLRAMLFTSEKVGIFGPSFRQAKFCFDEIEKLYERSPEFRACCKRKPVRSNDLCYVSLIGGDSGPGSVIHALPLGDGGTIRGARYYTVLGDETAQVPKDILDIVVRGMMATSKNPMENVRWIQRQKKLFEKGLVNSVENLYSNKTVLSSTSYFQYNHLWSRISATLENLMDKDRRNQKVIAEGGQVDPRDIVHKYGHPINDGQIPCNVIHDGYRSVMAFECDDLPEGFLSKETLDQAKLDMTRQKYMMEYHCLFPADSDGFFPRSAIDKTLNHSKFSCFDHDPAEWPEHVNIMGIDPARSSDNFAIVILSVIPKLKTVRLLRVLAYNKESFPVMATEIRKLIKRYNISEISMDSGGGGTTIRDLLADKEFCPIGEEPILQRGFDEHRLLAGRRMLRLVEFSNYDWMHNANHNLLLAFQNMALELPVEKDMVTAANGIDNDMSTTMNELAMREVDSLVDELQGIVSKTNSSGRMSWTASTKRAKKDRYSALLVGYDMAKSYLDNLSKPASLVSGFWA